MLLKNMKFRRKPSFNKYIYKYVKEQKWQINTG